MVPALEARNLTFRYSADRPVLDRWSESFESGSLSALTGPSGSGKSTLLYLLGVMLRPDEGEVLVDGRPVTRLRDADCARLRAGTFGFVFQDAALDSTRTVFDNITENALYLDHDRRKLVDEVARLLDRFEVDVPAHRKPGQLSGGQAQRIALCRALLHRPRIVLADEPTGNLDAATGHAVVRALRDHARDGGTVIVVTHDEALADGCDRVVRL